MPLINRRNFGSSIALVLGTPAGRLFAGGGIEPNAARQNETSEDPGSSGNGRESR